ncbi:DUF1015 domain-containing protein [Leptolinea tardivitalis]|uniref:DUF1015 domain-containing protein n=1 Tax=Leptolinea tardivitalis TaxID=229920 RepID=A0A0P6WSG8_9CHLR|nr:DUF1015 domain-containing protein [Leptolinea tardivitalis]KPL71904.1 hypothetical protein ADM99_10910 [Leptolinea tardivitalis]GAP20315.1 hypothetical protein LTAR_00503 [Leptolinea tardivitalis]
MHTFPSVGLQIPDILIPKSGIDLQKWAVIACDQFTSQPEYWEEVKKIVGDSPSTLNLILPEVFLGKEDEQSRIESTYYHMQAYLQQSVFASFEGMIAVERTVGSAKRKGLILALDLEKYDFNRGSQTMIRATEGTILDRLPPRIKIRQKASLELPHILVLIDDPEKTVIEPVIEAVESTPTVYDFDLMLESGHIRGWKVTNPQIEEALVAALENLAKPANFQKKYRVGPEKGVLLYAVGDGNHSLATAKSVWEMNKAKLGMDHPSRYALIELENLHDPALVFEPIHRILAGANPETVLAGMHAFYGARLKTETVDSMQTMKTKIKEHSGFSQCFGMLTADNFLVAEVMQPESNLPVGTLQAFLDSWLKTANTVKIDYVHGDDVLSNLSAQPSHVGFYLPAMSKGELFRTVILDGALPRKTFSMGEAREKRFYLEARKITK